MEEDDVLSGLHPDELLARAMLSDASMDFSDWQAPSAEQLSKIITGYMVKSILGKGGMGAVYQVYHADLDRLCALKLLPLEVSCVTGFEDRFIQEARAMARLNHPNIVTIHDFGRTSEGHLFYVMEYVEGLDLAELIKNGSLSVEQALEIVSQVCDALEYAHSAGYVHRDIKPANILVDRSGNAKVTDFGLAKLLSTKINAGMTMTGQVMGTPDYMAPEQSQGQEVDHRADIYALGVMLYELLTGSLPKGIFKPPSEKVEVSVKFDEVVIKAMQQQPELRYQRISEIKSSIKQASEVSSIIKKSSHQYKRWLIFLALVGCGILLISLNLFHLTDSVKQESNAIKINPEKWPKQNQTFTNHLGRTFTPITGTNVLFSETETTVKDWKLFLKQTNYDWSPAVSASQNHNPELPISSVSWHDANAYCQWLTKRERNTGRISAEMEYRLPTDREWSIAAGLKQEKVEKSYVKRFEKMSFRGMMRPIPDWLKKSNPVTPKWNPSDFSGVNSDIFPWGKYWPPKPTDTNAFPEREYQAYPQFSQYQKILKKPISQVHWGSTSSDLLKLYQSNFGQYWATDLTTFGPLALTRIAWIQRQGTARLFYFNNHTYCLVEPAMRLRQAHLLEQWLDAELADFKDLTEMQQLAKVYPHGDWSAGVAIGGRYKMKGEMNLPEWQEWQGYYTDSETVTGKWIWSHTGKEISPEWWQSVSAPKPSYLFETALVLKKNGLLEPVNRHANFPLLLRWKGKKTAAEINVLCGRVYKTQVKAILDDFERTLALYIRPNILPYSKKNASTVVVKKSAISISGLRGISGNVSEWVADSMTNPNTQQPILAWARGAAWKLTGGRNELLSSHRKSNLCTDYSEFIGFRPVLAFTHEKTPTYQPDQLNNHYYAFIKLKQDWQTAARLCRQAGGYLLSLETQEEEAWIKKRFVDYGGIYLGASRTVAIDSTVKRAGPWTWESGSPFSYFPKRIPHNFSLTEPILRLNLNRDGWYDDNEKAKGSYIIEWEKQD